MKRQKRIHLLLLMIVMLFFTTTKTVAQNDNFLSWNEAINLALNANQSLIASQANLEVQKLDVSIAKANFLPSLHFSGSYLPSIGQKISNWDGLGNSNFTQGLLSVGMKQMIYNEKFVSEHKIQKALYASQEEQYRSAKYKIITTTAQAYINVLLSNELLFILNKNIELTGSNLNASIDREKVGLTGHQEVLRWETQLFSNKQQIVDQEATVVINRVTLNQVLDKPEEDIHTVEKLNIEKNGFIFSSKIVSEALGNPNKAKIIRDYLVDLGLQNYPDLVSADYEIAASEQQLKSNQRWLIPDFSLVAGGDELFLIAKDENDNRQKSGVDFWFAGVSMNWDIFNGGSNFSKVKQSKWQVKTLNAEKKELTSSLKQYIRSNAAVTISSFQKIAFSQAQNKAANENYNEVLDAYYVGESSLLDLLDAQEQKISSDIKVKTTTYSFFLNLMGLQQAIGYFSFLNPQVNVDEIIAELEKQLMVD